MAACLKQIGLRKHRRSVLGRPRLAASGTLDSAAPRDDAPEDQPLYWRNALAGICLVTSAESSCSKTLRGNSSAPVGRLSVDPCQMDERGAQEEGIRRRLREVHRTPFVLAESDGVHAKCSRLAASTDGPRVRSHLGTTVRLSSGGEVATPQVGRTYKDVRIGSMETVVVAMMQRAFSRHSRRRYTRLRANKVTSASSPLTVRRPEAAELGELRRISCPP